MPHNIRPQIMNSTADSRRRWIGQVRAQPRVSLRWLPFDSITVPVVCRCVLTAMPASELWRVRRVPRVCGGTEIAGNLTVRGSALTALALPNLLVVRGLVIEANTALTSVRLPALKASDDVLLVGNAVLETLEIPALKEVGGEFAMRENDKLDTVRITSLTKVAGNFDISTNPQLTTMEATTLEDELIVHTCDLDATRPYKEGIFHFGKNRRIEHYGPITSQTAAELPG